MKPNMHKLVKRICDTCIMLAVSLAFAWGSFVFFGEPKFPQEDEF